MDSYDVVYLSSNEENPFQRNQRLIQEHHVEEDADKYRVISLAFYRKLKKVNAKHYV